MPAPKIDPRTYEQIVAQLKVMAEHATAGEWQHHATAVLVEAAKDAKGNNQIPAGTLLNAELMKRLSKDDLKKIKIISPLPTEEADAGGALIRIFGHYMEALVNRLNAAPEKNFLAFLNLIGADILPPQPARVPLTFQLAASSLVNVRVPAGTQVAAPPTDGKNEAIFETEQDLVISHTELVAVFAHEPKTDYYSDYTNSARGLSNQSFIAFQDKEHKAVEHELYLGDDIFGLTAAKTITLTFTSPDAMHLGEHLNIWSAWDGKAWQIIEPDSKKVEGGACIVVFDKLPTIVRRNVNRLETYWLKVQPDGQPKLSSTDQPPTIQRVDLTIKVSSQNLAADLAFNNGIPLDLTKDFYPFGERPRFGECLYLASREVFSKPGASVTVNFKVTTALPLQPNPQGLKIQWEVWDGSTWKSLSIGTTSTEFIQDGSVAFTLPAQTSPGTFFGHENYWLRVRILAGTYQQPAYNQPLVDKTGKEIKGDDGITSIYTQVPATFTPPSLSALTLSYVSPDEKRTPTACQSCNALSFRDHAIENVNKKSYIPFISLDGPEPTLYLGFNANFDNVPVTLYTQIEQPTSAEVTRRGLKSALFDKKAPELDWHYSAPADGWKALKVIDETNNFSNSGLIHFIAPADFAETSLFGRKLYWLRISLKKNSSFPVSPRLRCLLLNTTWASQFVTVRNELIGSSNGNPHQVFRLAQAPLLPGLRLEVREADMLPAGEQAQIQKCEGADAITITRDQAGNSEEIWVCWSAVPDFHSSMSHDRHYTIDCLTGTVRFGDGRNGRVPPMGQNNIRAAQYRVGGGAAGNRPAGTIVQLKSSLPYVAKVTNPEPASGGTDQQSLEDVKRYGPRQLRHRGHAVALEDFEDLAFAASADVARAKAIPPAPEHSQFDLWLPVKGPTPDFARHKTVTNAGKVHLMIVPHSDSPQPVPSVGLISHVKAWLEARCPGDAELWVTGPDWVKVSVTANVAPVSPALATQLPMHIITALEKFLHPLTGGALRKGWPFGRKPRLSDLYTLLESVEGVDHVVSLQLKLESDPQRKLDSQLTDPDISFDNQNLIYSGQHQVTISS